MLNFNKKARNMPTCDKKTPTCENGIVFETTKMLKLDKIRGD